MPIPAGAGGGRQGIPHRLKGLQVPIVAGLLPDDQTTRARDCQMFLDMNDGVQLTRKDGRHGWIQGHAFHPSSAGVPNGTMNQNVAPCPATLSTPTCP